MRQVDTDGILDLCHCGARARFATNGRNGLHSVECSECGECSRWHGSQSGAMVDWNRARREEVEAAREEAR